MLCQILFLIRTNNLLLKECGDVLPSCGVRETYVQVKLVILTQCWCTSRRCSGLITLNCGEGDRTLSMMGCHTDSLI